MPGNGWIKLHRKLLDSRVFANPNLLKVWIWCLARAAHEGHFVAIKTGRGDTEVWLAPGQLIYGRSTAAEELKMSESCARHKIDKLKKFSNIEVKTTSHYSIITICKWDTYQSCETENGQANNQAIANQQPGKEPHTRMYKNDKNEKKKNTLAQAQALKFAQFWKAYPKKRSKGQAERTWKKLNPDDALLETILAGIERAKTSNEWTRTAPDGGNYIPYPSTWLNAKGWEDEHEHGTSATRRTSTGAKPGMEPSKSFDGWDALFGKK